MNKINGRYVDAPTITALRTAVFKLHPYHCTDCNKTVNFKCPEFNYELNGVRILLHASMRREALCGECLAKRIERWFKTPKKEFKPYHRKDRKRNTCQVCKKKNKIVATAMWEDWCNVRFGSSHWNGHWICCDCLTACARLGSSHAGISALIKGKTYLMNEFGAMIET